MKPDITLILPVKNEDKILFKNINKYKRKIESITKKKIIIIEGASWIGYVYFLIKLLNILIKNVKIIYHAHNLEYEVRKLKNSKIISLISFYFEKFT